MTDLTYRRTDSEDSDGNPITFEGRILGHASSRRDDRQQRWMEVTIFVTKAGTYVVEIIGHTIREGEVTKQRAHILTEPSEVIERLHTTRDGERYITYTAREALFQAAEADPGISSAWDAQARVVA